MDPFSNPGDAPDQEAPQQKTDTPALNQHQRDVLLLTFASKEGADSESPQISSSGFMGNPKYVAALNFFEKQGMMEKQGNLYVMTDLGKETLRNSGAIDTDDQINDDDKTYLQQVVKDNKLHDKGYALKDDIAGPGDLGDVGNMSDFGNPGMDTGMGDTSPMMQGHKFEGNLLQEINLRSLGYKE